MTDERLDEPMARAARDYNAPPEVPREEMWSVIRATLEAQRSSGPQTAGRHDDRRSRPGHRRWPRWAPPLAAAAMLTAGFGLGRFLTSPPPPQQPAGHVAARDAAAPLPVRMETARHMGEAEAMLTLFRTSSRDEDRAATAEWARELLTTTRLLLDSRAADDPRMAQLLADLEVILVQIVNAGAADGALVEEGIEQRQLIAKLRAVADPVQMPL